MSHTKQTDKHAKRGLHSYKIKKKSLTSAVFSPAVWWLFSFWNNNQIYKRGELWCKDCSKPFKLQVWWIGKLPQTPNLNQQHWNTCKFGRRSWSSQFETGCHFINYLFLREWIGKVVSQRSTPSLISTSKHIKNNSLVNSANI